MSRLGRKRNWLRRLRRKSNGSNERNGGGRRAADGARFGRLRWENSLLAAGWPEIRNSISSSIVVVRLHLSTANGTGHVGGAKITELRVQVDMRQSGFVVCPQRSCRWHFSYLRPGLASPPPGRRKSAQKVATSADIPRRVANANR